MKKMNSKGFTLIELLAVITIMGILMLVAIPAVSRTIENSRRDTYMDTAKAYLNAVKNSVSADEIKCKVKDEGSSSSDFALDGTNATVISAQPAGDYYLPFSSENASGQDLLEQGGVSSWGSAHVKGTVKISKTVDSTTGLTKYTYAIIMIDAGGRGIGPVYVDETVLTRQDVKTAGLNTDYGNADKAYSTMPSESNTTGVAAPRTNICRVVTG